MHGTAGVVSFFQLQTSVSNHLEVIFVICPYLIDSPVASCCPFCNRFSFDVLEHIIQASGQLLSGLEVFWKIVGLPSTHLYPSGSLVRKIPNPLLRKIDTRRIGP